MRGHGEKLGRKGEAAIAALLSRRTVEEAAAEAGVSYSTLKGWLRRPAFRAAYAAARERVLERTVARLLAVTGKAVDALEKNLDAREAKDSTRAAVAVLTHAVRGVEALDLAGQVAELRQQLEGMRGVHGNAENGAGPAANGRRRPDAGAGGDAAPAAGRPDRGNGTGGADAGPVADEGAPKPLW